MHHLDFIRGISALAVLIYHVRYRFFVDYADLSFATAGDNAFYALTSFGHDAVIVFFVLSGYLISSSVVRDLRCEQWSWSKYASSRLIRLYVVLIPGLLLTLFWDKLGLWCFKDSAIYTGVAQSWRHDYFNVPDRLAATTFWGNLGFLQGIVVPPFGSNAPLWSLAFEFWYYVLFPLAVLALTFARTIVARVGYCIATLVVGMLIGRTILVYFPIWLLGTVVFLLPRAVWLERRPAIRVLFTVASCMGFAMATAMGHIESVKEQLGNMTVIMDYITACGFAIMLYSLLHDNRDSKSGWYKWLAIRLAGSSYTLYVVHMPLLCFLRAMFIESEPWMPSLGSLCAACGIGVVAILYAMGVAFLAESRTDWLQRLAKEKLLPRQRMLESILKTAARIDNRTLKDAIQVPSAKLDSLTKMGVKQ